MTSILDDVCCASLPPDALGALAELRCGPDIHVKVHGDRLWVRWRQGDEEVIRRVFPLPGAELFLHRDGSWYRPGCLLPSFGLPVDDCMKPLHQCLVPAPVSPGPPSRDALRPQCLTLVRTESARRRTGMICAIAEFAGWADGATSHELSSIRGAHSNGWVILQGRTLPTITAAERFWGEKVLIPLGYRTNPAIPEAALREALGVAEEDLLVLRHSGGELIPTTAFQPVTRAGVRHALQGSF